MWILRSSKLTDIALRDDVPKLLLSGLGSPSPPLAHHVTPDPLTGQSVKGCSAADVRGKFPGAIGPHREGGWWLIDWAAMAPGFRPPH